ncbi:MAG: hypothetical protein QM831_20815 [Kofleriaceae bacterium]
MVHVVFVDRSTGNSIGETDLEPTALPESFAVATQLTIAGKQWSVAKAEPQTRAEYTRSGQLRLELNPIVMMDPRRILFSLPTIENTQPALVPGDASNALDLHEDSWRQIEVIDPKYRALIERERDEIHLVISERQGAGFTRIHVREAIPDPVSIPDDLPGKRRPLAIGGMIVVDGFAIGEIYGRSKGGVISELCATDAAALAPIAERHGLVLVDWTRD